MYFIYSHILHIFEEVINLIRMRLITLNLPEAYIEGIEKLVQAEIYPNRSETIRHAVRDLIIKEDAYNPIKRI